MKRIMCSIENNKLYLQFVLAKEGQKQREWIKERGRGTERERERENKRKAEEPLASQQIKHSAHLSAVTVKAHQYHWQLAKLMGKCHDRPIRSPLSPYKVTTIDTRCEIAMRDVANFGLSKFISFLRSDIFYINLPYTSFPCHTPAPAP